MEKVSNFQIALMACAFTLNSALISIATQMFGIAKRDAWMGYLFALVVPVFAWWMICKLLSRFPEQDLLAILIHRVKWIGKWLAGGYLLFILIILVRDIRMVSDFVNIIMLNNTPTIFITLLAVTSAIWIVRGGIELVGRLTEIYQTFLIFVILLLPIFLFREIDRTDFLPIFENGVVPVIGAGWYSVAYISEFVIIACMLASKQVPFRSGLAGFFLGIFLLELLIVFNIFVFGPELASKFMYPNQEMVREIRFTDFLDRLDLPIVGIWIPAMIVKISFSLYAICHGMKRFLPSINPKPLVAPVGMFVVACSMWFFSDAFQLLNWNKTWPLFALLFEFVIPVLLFFGFWGWKQGQIWMASWKKG